MRHWKDNREWMIDGTGWITAFIGTSGNYKDCVVTEGWVTAPRYHVVPGTHEDRIRFTQALFYARTYAF